MSQHRVFFFPLMAPGHMIPILDMARLFASHGVKSTIITTPLNAKYFTNTFSETTKQLPRYEIAIRTMKFPSIEAGLPENCENMEQLMPDLHQNFWKATIMLRDPFEQILKEEKPDCLVADMFLPWAIDIAANLNIPRLIFYGGSVFSYCVTENLSVNIPQRDVKFDDQLFLVPNLPHEIKLTRMQLSPEQRQVTDTNYWFDEVLRQVKESEVTSYGFIVNSFHELEPEYINHHISVLKRKIWAIGPVSLWNRLGKDKAQRGKEASIDLHKCLTWLDSKIPNSVVYVCFGSLTKFSTPQLHEIAMGLVNSEQNFIWVVKKLNCDEGKNEEWLPDEFEERTKEMGLIIRGWAPQVLILDHDATGCFLTHCGWNSTLESITAGVPMVTWPICADQFYNEKLVTDILKIGIGVGSTWEGGDKGKDVERKTIAKSLKEVMYGDEAEAMRNRAMELKISAKKATEEGGSSLNDLKALLNCLSS